MVTSFRATAVTTTLSGFPAARRRSAKVSGLGCDGWLPSPPVESRSAGHQHESARLPELTIAPSPGSRVSTFVAGLCRRISREGQFSPKSEGYASPGLSRSRSARDLENAANNEVDPVLGLQALAVEGRPARLKRIPYD
jgi:hypothetical protein